MPNDTQARAILKQTDDECSYHNDRTLGLVILIKIYLSGNNCEENNCLSWFKIAFSFRTMFYVLRGRFVVANAMRDEE